MILSMSDQAWLFLTTVLAGFVIGIVYDAFRIVRKIVSHRYWMVQLEDILYWLSVSLMMFYFMLHRNYGEIRFFSIAGVALGTVIYFCSLSLVVMKVSVAVIRFFQKVILAVADILFAPIRWLLRLIAPFGKWLLYKAKGNVRYVKRGVNVKLRVIRRSVFVMTKKI